MRITSQIIFFLSISLIGPAFSSDEPPTVVTHKDLSDPDAPIPFPARPETTIKVPDKLYVESSKNLKEHELKADEFEKFKNNDINALKHK